MKTLLCVSKNGEKVWCDVENSNLRLHVIENPNLLACIKEAIEKSDLEGEKVALQTDLGRSIGLTSCVRTSDEDEIVYAKRIDREKYTRFVKNRKLVSTNHVVAILFKKPDGYLLWSGWCGELLPQEPDGQGGTRTKRSFERTHALVFDEKIIQTDTVLSEAEFKKRSEAGE